VSTTETVWFQDTEPSATADTPDTVDMLDTVDTLDSVDTPDMAMDTLEVWDIPDSAVITSTRDPPMPTLSPMPTPSAKFTVDTLPVS